MSYDGNFQKGMLAVTYYTRSTNMSKQSTKSTIFFLDCSTKSDRDTARRKRNAGLLTAGNRARAKCGGTKKKKKRNGTQTRSNVTTRSLQGPLLCVNLLSVNICFPSIQTCKISNPREIKRTHKTRTHSRTDTHTHTHDKMLWTPANLPTLHTKPDHLLTRDQNSV